MGTFEFLMEQVNGGYIAHLCKFVTILFSVMDLGRAGVTMTDKDISNLREDLVPEDEFADFLCRAVMSIVGRRITRSLWVPERLS